MEEQNTDVIQGTLDMLILKTLSLEPMHGFGIGAAHRTDLSRRVQSESGVAAHCISAAGAHGLARFRVARLRQLAPSQILFADPLRQEAACSGDGDLEPPGVGNRAPVESRRISMSLWRHLSRGLRVLGNRDAADEAIGDEVGHYVDEMTREGIARGLSPEAARRRARLEVGSPLATREQVRDYGWENRIDALLSGVWHGARRLRSNPGFTAVSVLTLALGIGASTAIFSVIDWVLIRPLPYPQSDRLVALLHTAPGINFKELNLALSLYFTYSEESRVFQDVGMWTPWAWNVTGKGAAEQVWGLSVTHGFLSALGVRPALGRAFTSADDTPHSELTVMLSNGFWKSRFGGDRAIVGRRILMDGEAYTVIGVLPRDFQFMDRATTVLTASRWDRARSP